MKTVTISIPDAQAAALEQAVTAGDFASPSELVSAALEDFMTTPIDCDADALARDVAEHQAAKTRGEAGLGPDVARAWLRAARARPDSDAARRAGFR